MKNFPFMLLTLLLFFADARASTLKKIRVAQDQVVAEDVAFLPAMAVIIEFPGDIVGQPAISDRESFQCVRLQPSFNKILCKALLSDATATNAVIVTEHNEFILNFHLVSDKFNFCPKLVFYQPGLGPDDKIKRSVAAKTPEYDSSQDLLKTFASDFKLGKCPLHSSRGDLRFECLEEIHFGQETFLRFKLKHQRQGKVNLLGVALIERTYGGITGLKVLNESASRLDHAISDNQSSQVTAAIKMPQVPDAVSAKAYLLKIMTEKTEIEVRL